MQSDISISDSFSKVLASLKPGDEVIVISPQDGENPTKETLTVVWKTNENAILTADGQIINPYSELELVVTGNHLVKYQISPAARQIWSFVAPYQA